MRKFDITVTQECINNGQRFRSHYDPVALAINQSVKEAVDAFTCYTLCGFYTRPNNPRAAILFITPTEVADKMMHFDKTGEMMPFSFSVVEASDEQIKAYRAARLMEIS